MIITGTTTHKEHVIALNDLSPPSSTTADAASCTEVARFEIAGVSSRRNPYNQDIVSRIFGQASQVHEQVEQVLSVVSQSLECDAFVYRKTVFMTLPSVFGQSLTRWSQSDFNACITHLIELAEEKTECDSLIIVIDKEDKNSKTILRALLYLGFQMVDPRIYRQDARYILAGYEI